MENLFSDYLSVSVHNPILLTKIQIEIKAKLKDNFLQNFPIATKYQRIGGWLFSFEMLMWEVYSQFIVKK